MNVIGIDVSKGKSMIAVMRPFGEVVAKPFEAHHTNQLSFGNSIFFVMPQS